MTYLFPIFIMYSSRQQWYDSYTCNYRYEYRVDEVWYLESSIVYIEGSTHTDLVRHQYIPHHTEQLRSHTHDSEHYSTAESSRVFKSVQYIQNHFIHLPIITYVPTVRSGHMHSIISRILYLCYHLSPIIITDDL